MLYAIRPDGSQKCRAQIGSVSTQPGSTPAIAADNTIYVGGTDGLYAFNPDCSKKWKLGETETSASPVIGADGTIYWRTRDWVYAVKSDGSPKWSLNASGGNSGMVPSMALGANGALYAAGGLFTGEPWTPLGIFSIADVAAHKLKVASVNPSSGVAIGVSATDNRGRGNGSTPVTRIYSHNSAVTLSAPGVTGGYTFQKWQRDGVDVGTSASIQVTMDANHSMTAVYVPPSCPAEVIVDNLPAGQSSAQVEFTGTWKGASQANSFGLNASLVSAGVDLDTYTWKTPVLSAAEACTYQVFVWWTSAAGRSMAVPYTVRGQVGGAVTKRFNQRVGGGQWNLHGTYTFPAGAVGKVKVSDQNGKAAVDAVRFVLVR